MRGRIDGETGSVFRTPESRFASAGNNFSSVLTAVAMPPDIAACVPGQSQAVLASDIRTDIT